MFDPLTLRPTRDIDPPPFHLFNQDGSAPFLLTCDHASNALPLGYGSLGIAPEKMFEHIAWDVGAAAVTRQLSMMLDAPAILGGTSRLFVDLNRYPDDPTAVATRSDGVHVTGNEGLDTAEHAHRMEWHSRYHSELENQLDRLRSQGNQKPPIIFIHSFTPVFANHRRPWHVGVLHNHDSPLSGHLLTELQKDDRLVVGDNKPYSVDEPRSYSIFQHAIEQGREYIALEIRQDLIENISDAESWGEMLEPPLRRALENIGIRTAAKDTAAAE